jgi:hypothetical protein
MLLCQLQERRWIELVHQNSLTTSGDRRKKTHKRRVRIQRRRDDCRARRAIAVSGDDPSNLLPAHLVRMHNALRLTSGSRRVNDIEDTIRIEH